MITIYIGYARSMRNNCVNIKHKILFAHTIDFVIYIVSVDFSLWLVYAIASNIHEKDRERERKRETKDLKWVNLILNINYN